MINPMMANGTTEDFCNWSKHAIISLNISDSADSSEALMHAKSSLHFSVAGRNGLHELSCISFKHTSDLLFSSS